jgi:hypothetical protein
MIITGSPMARNAKAGVRHRAAAASGPDHRRQGDQPAQPLQQRLRGRRHVTRLAGPDRHRQHHRVAGGKAGNAKRAGQFAALRVIRRLQRVGQEGGHAIADVTHKLRQAVGQRRRPVPDDHQAPQGQVEARMAHRRVGPNRALDPLDAGGAENSLDQQIDDVPALRMRPAKTRNRRLGLGGHEGRRRFFFEKKKQKTFIPWRLLLSTGASPVERCEDPYDKSFLLLFFKKEALPFLLLMARRRSPTASSRFACRAGRRHG